MILPPGCGRMSGCLRVHDVIVRSAGDPEGLGPVVRRVMAGIDPDMIMPPEDEPLTAAEIAKLRAWIDAGAVWPDDVAESTKRATNHWAFKAPLRPKVPQSTAWAEMVRNPIDAFVLARLEREARKPSPEADKATLIRRVSLDLLR